jgi:CubicO group peptidase (beta-lactamase class C family)
VSSLRRLAGWEVPHASAAVVRADGVRETFGDPHHIFRLASISKLMAAYATLIAVEEGSVDLYSPAGPEGATVRHLLAHAAGYGFDSGSKAIVPPGRRRIYSNQGIDVLAAHVAEQTGMPFADYLAEAVFQPLGMLDTTLQGSPAAHIWSTRADTVRFAAELLEPTLLAAETFRSATTVHFPGLDGVLPGYGRHHDLTWGLGFEIKGGKHPHWSGTRTGPATFGHFGGSGTFVWVEPSKRLALVVLTDREFGDWAVPLWSELSDAVMDEYG